jgi:hypothetical protein
MYMLGRAARLEMKRARLGQPHQAAASADPRANEKREPGRLGLADAPAWHQSSRGSRSRQLADAIVEDALALADAAAES